MKVKYSSIKFNIIEITITTSTILSKDVGRNIKKYKAEFSNNLLESRQVSYNTKMKKNSFMLKDQYTYLLVELQNW